MNEDKKNNSDKPTQKCLERLGKVCTKYGLKMGELEKIAKNSSFSFLGLKINGTKVLLNFIFNYFFKYINIK